MGMIKKLVGWFVLLIFGVPSMLAAISVVTLSQDALISAYTSKVPQQIVRDLPPLADLALRVMAKSPEMAKDPEARKWLMAFAEAPMKLSEVFEKSGLKAWSEGELILVLSQLGEVVRGKTTAKPIHLRLGPYYAALTGSVMQAYTKGVMAKLPPCQIAQQARWTVALTKRASESSYPACSPNEDILRLGWAQWQAEAAKQAKEHTLLTRVQSQEIAGVLVMARMFSWLAFFMPLCILCLGALIVTSTGTRGFVMSVGFAIALSGGSVLLSSSVAREGLTHLAASGLDLTRLSSGLPFVSDRAAQKLADMALPFLKTLVEPLLGAFVTVSSLVLGVGVGVFLGSFLIAAARRKEEEPVQVVRIIRKRD